MSLRSRRFCSSTAASNSASLPSSEFTTALRETLLTISDELHDVDATPSQCTSRLSLHVRILRDSIESAPEKDRPKDAFRQLNGFQTILRVIRSTSGSYHPTKRTKQEKEKLFDLLHNTLCLLAEVLRGHHGNRRYFKQRVEGGGWTALEQSIASIGFGGDDLDTWSENQLFGILLAFAADDEKVVSACHDLSQLLGAGSGTPTAGTRRGIVDDDRIARHFENPATASITNDEVDRFTMSLKRSLDVRLKANKVLWNPEIAPTIIGLWRSLSRQLPLEEAPASIIVILAMSRICLFSQSNLLGLHSSGILSSLLPMAFDEDTRLSKSEQRAVEELCGSLMSLGLSGLDDARYLLKSKCSRAQDFLLRMTKVTKNPPHIQFDLSLHGHSSIELPTLGRPFPPSSTLPGYTFCAWIYIDKFDPKAHTTIFGAYDSSRTCFCLAYLEKDTHNFILQTSSTSTKASVRFKQMVFKEKRWYHIAFVHKRPRTITGSTVAMYVDGELAERTKLQYPASPLPSNSSTESFASFTSSSTRLQPVKAFLGTPEELSERIGRGVVTSKWSLASAHLFEDTLSDDIIAVYFTLGPRYNGNYQDCLGSFQTYERGVSLALRNELLHPGKDGKSDIVTAIRDKGSMVVPEARLLMSVLPTASFGDDIQGEMDMSQLVGGLSSAALKNLYRYTHGTGTSIVINAALPFYNDTLVYPNGVAMLVGGPVVIVPQALDDAMWRLGGCTGIGLKLVDNGRTPDGILRAVEIFLDCVRGSWRNSEAMERENGYAILATLLRNKLSSSAQASFANGDEKESSFMSAEERDKLSFQLLSVILGFVGYNHARPIDSMINNPMAYRILLVDFDTWRKSGPLTQKLYYKQFVTFTVECKNHHLNSVRLSRMKVVKRLVNAMKAESFTQDIFPSFLEAFKVLVVADLGVEVLRMLALFITYTLHQPRSSTSRTPKPRYSTGCTSISVPSGQKAFPLNTMPENKLTLNTSPVMTKREVGRALLQMYTDILCEKGNTSRIKKFATTVTNKWILHLLTEDDPEVVVLATKLIARLLVNHGHVYIKKFADPQASGGFIIMQYRLKRWWDLPPLYPTLFSILFNSDVAEVDFERPFDLSSLSDIFRGNFIANPDVFPIIIAMIQTGLNSILHNQDDPDSPKFAGDAADDKLAVRPEVGRKRSMSLTKELESQKVTTPKKEKISDQAEVLHALIRFLRHLHSSSQNFRDFAIMSDYVRLLLGVLFPAILSTDPVRPETELNSKDSALNFDGEDVIIRSTSSIGSVTIPVVRASTVETYLDTDSAHANMRARPLRRGSSFILLTAKKTEPKTAPSKAKLASNAYAHPMVAQKVSNTVVEELMELVMMVFVDQILVRKEFPGFGLPFKIPPGFQEHQAYFQSYILRNTISYLSNNIKLDSKLLEEPRVINNMARFSLHISEAIFEGWLLGGAEPLLDFTGYLLDHFQQPEVAKVKAVRLCNQAIHTISTVFLRVSLLRLSEIDSEDVTEEEAVRFLHKLMYWQVIFLTTEVGEGDFLKLFCYQLYGKLIDPRENIRHVAADLWRTLLMQKPEEISAILVMSMDRSALITGFKKIQELDNEAFLGWIAKHQDGLNKAFYGGLNRIWIEFVAQENARTDETTKCRVAQRKDKLRQWLAEERNEGDIILRHELAARLWCKNIYAAEQLKHLRNVQDMQENLAFLQSEFAKMDRDLHRTCAVFDSGVACKWRLDETEGRNRMRLRLIPDRTELDEYQPKTKQPNRKSIGSINTKAVTSSSGESTTVRPSSAKSISLHDSKPSDDSSSAISIADSGKPEPENDKDDVREDEFEFVDDPRDPRDEDGFEDRQRKVMRSLKRGDQVQNVFNISRIIGLEACEGLLILGKDCLYLIDDFFQRSDGEIVNVWDAPSDERDPYVQMISGSEVKGKRAASGEQESRSWKWSEILSVSKRRFLFRDVAVEIFFADGRSYLLTALDMASRNDLHSKMANKAPQLGDKRYSSEGEDSWRMEALKTADEQPTTFSSRLAGLMNNSAWNPSMKRWAKGEMSNFHYLMLVNTMAGRTFNDLTQYPVFPWIIADYTSEELDFNNPATFRDLSKPMGCQIPSRQADFIERYNSFAEMGEKNPFHYGTHYSSAMIVAGYLIRLQPFVQSYLLIQGGNFDHPDRMFYSIPGAWLSASQGTMTDVRELTPEFFYLPEFLTNSNGFNFGTRQADGASIDNVELPPWAKGDPKIFIAKNREALESPYVSAHLHEWIDLVFGCKQQGEAAVENVNVFHHLSYRGATDLDAIQDHQEKLQVISIIHNFGQTPHQVFSKPHQSRDDWSAKPKRLDTCVSSLTRLPFPLFDYADAISSMYYSVRQDRLACSSSFRLNMPPTYSERYMEWGYADNSIRCWSSDGKKLYGLFENCHQGQLSKAIFVDSKTLVTAGIDCVLSLWNVKVESSGKSVAMTPKTSLFGHRQPVSTVAVSRSFSTILSASTDGVVILWDLNRLEFVRKLASGRSVQCAQINNLSGDIMLCRGQKVALHTLNGDLILDQNVCGEADDFIYSCAFYEGVGNEWLENTLIFTGHKHGVVHCWRKCVGKNGKWCLELVKTLEHIDPRKPNERSAAAITAILPMAKTVYTGNEDGKAVSSGMKRAVKLEVDVC